MELCGVTKGVEKGLEMLVFCARNTRSFSFSQIALLMAFLARSYAKERELESEFTYKRLPLKCLSSR